MLMLSLFVKVPALFFSYKEQGSGLPSGMGGMGSGVPAQPVDEPADDSFHGV